MQKLDIDSLDLRSLRLLSHLLATASVTQTAKLAGLSQPATSRWLARLRTALGDPLLIRGPKGWGLTARAMAVAPRLAMILSEIDALFAPEDFDPATTRRRFSLASTDYGALAVVPEFMAAMGKTAPMAGIDLKPWESGTLEELADGRIDLALFADGPLPGDFHFRPLFSDDYVVVARHEHPALGPNGLNFAACRRVAFVYPEGRGRELDDALGEALLQSDLPALTTSYFALAPFVLAGGDLVMVAPRRIAQRFGPQLDLAILPAPFDLKGFGYRLIWHARCQNDPGHRWLRGLIADAVAPRRPGNPSDGA